MVFGNTVAYCILNITLVLYAFLLFTIFYLNARSSTKCRFCGAQNIFHAINKIIYFTPSLSRTRRNLVPSISIVIYLPIHFRYFPFYLHVNFTLRITKSDIFAKLTQIKWLSRAILLLFTYCLLSNGGYFLSIWREIPKRPCICSHRFPIRASSMWRETWLFVIIYNE